MKSTIVALLFTVLAPALSAADKPNILFIAIDDQNDWIGHLGGHPMAKTPNLDRLAARGTAFLNAHVQSPLCNPSRTSLMLGLRPTTTGVYGLSPWFRNVPRWQDRVTLPLHFANHGYRTFATGKIYHSGTGGGGARNAKVKPEFQVTAPYGGVGTRPPKKLIGDTPMGNNPLMDWGVWPLDNDDTGKGDFFATCDGTNLIPADVSGFDPVFGVMDGERLKGSGGTLDNRFVALHQVEHTDPTVGVVRHRF